RPCRTTSAPGRCGARRHWRRRKRSANERALGAERQRAGRGISQENAVAGRGHRAVLARIEKFNPVLNAFNLVSETALEDAKASEQRWTAGQPKGLLDGVPVSIKDIILTKGWP